jgi:hypothetical protein
LDATLASKRRVAKTSSFTKKGNLKRRRALKGKGIIPVPFQEEPQKKKGFKFLPIHDSNSSQEMLTSSDEGNSSNNELELELELDPVHPMPIIGRSRSTAGRATRRTLKLPPNELEKRKTELDILRADIRKDKRGK